MGFPQLWRVWAREAPCGPAHEVGLGFELLGYGGGGGFGVDLALDEISGSLTGRTTWQGLSG